MSKLVASQAGANSWGVPVEGRERHREEDRRRCFKNPSVLLIVILCVFAIPALAQDQPAPSQEQPPTQETTPQPESTPAPPPAHPKAAKRPDVTPKIDLSAGFSHRTYYSPATGPLGLPGNVGMNGFYATVDYNRYRYVAYEGEISATRGDQGGVGGINGEVYIYSMMLGVRINPLRHRKFTPFAHGLLGNGLYQNVVPNFSNFQGGTLLKDKFTYEGGAGVDLNLWEHWGIRVIEVDFSSANYYHSSTNYANSMSRRISFGFVYRFGRR